MAEPVLPFSRPSWCESPTSGRSNGEKNIVMLRPDAMFLMPWNAPYLFALALLFSAWCQVEAGGTTPIDTRLDVTNVPESFFQPAKQKADDIWIELYPRKAFREGMMGGGVLVE